MEGKLKALFDFQRFMRDAALDAVIQDTDERYGKAEALTTDQLELVSAAGDPHTAKENIPQREKLIP